MTESLAAATFYVGLALFIFGAVRATRASIEHQRNDRLGFASIAVGVLCFSVAIAIFLQSSKGVLPF